MKKIMCVTLHVDERKQHFYASNKNISGGVSTQIE